MSLEQSPSPTDKGEYLNYFIYYRPLKAKKSVTKIWSIFHEATFAVKKVYLGNRSLKANDGLT